jgi:probable addiction module antidote protein
MATKTIEFEAAQHLSSLESQAELLTDALDSGDAGYIANALGVIARARGVTEVASGAGVTREALYKILGPDGDPKMTTFLGVVKSLGFTLSVRTAR